MTGDPVVSVPGDLNVEDRLAGPVTFRMAAWLAASAGGVALVATSDGALWRVTAGLLFAGAGLVGAWWRPGGRPAAAWIVPLLAYRKRRNNGVRNAVQDKPLIAEVCTESLRSRRKSRLSRRRIALLAATAAIVGASVLAGRDALTAPPATPTPPVATTAEPSAAPPPVIVVVPADPLLPWGVDGEEFPGLGFGCGC